MTAKEPECSWLPAGGAKMSLAAALRAVTDRDKLIRSDEPWAVAAQAYVQAKQEADAMAECLNVAKERLVQLASHPSESRATA